MVNSGIPVRNSTKIDVPSLMPLPTAADGFDWHQRRRRRSRRRAGLLHLSSPAFSLGSREAAVRQVLDSVSGNDPTPEDYRQGTQTSQRVSSDEEGGVMSVTGDQQDEDEEDGGKGGVGRGLGLGWLLVSDWRFKNSEMERDARCGGVLALERKRRRMSEFSRKARERRVKVDAARGGIDSEGGGNVVGEEDDSSVAVSDGEVEKTGAGRTAQLDLRPGGRRGRNEALTLRMRVGHTPGLLGRGTRSSRRDRGGLERGGGGDEGMGGERRQGRGARQGDGGGGGIGGDGRIGMV